MLNANVKNVICNKNVGIKSLRPLGERNKVRGFGLGGFVPVLQNWMRLLNE